MREVIPTETKILGINFESLVDGNGVRVTIFFSGCLHHCKGCHNPISHDFSNGRLFTSEIQNEIIQYINETPFIGGITLSGGDPMYSAASIVPFIKELRAKARKIDIWVYSGFVFEEILKNESMSELLRLCDVLVDGPYIASNKSPNLRFKGSTNQRIIDIQKSLCTNQVQTLGD